MPNRIYLSLFLGLLLVVVSGCVINVTPQNLIYQSPNVEKLDLTHFQGKAFKDGISVAVKPVRLERSVWVSRGLFWPSTQSSAAR